MNRFKVGDLHDIAWDKTWPYMSHSSTSEGEITGLVDSEAEVDDALVDIFHVPPSFDYCCSTERQVLRTVFGAAPSLSMRSIVNLSGHWRVTRSVPLL